MNGDDYLLMSGFGEDYVGIIYDYDYYDYYKDVDFDRYYTLIYEEPPLLQGVSSYNNYLWYHY